MWDRLVRIAAPAETPVSLAEAKAHLRVDSSEDDTLIGGLLASATAYFDGPNGIGLALCTQTWEVRLDVFPCGPICIPIGPVASITSLKYFDPDGVEQTWAGSNYESDLTAPARVRPLAGGAWPAIRDKLAAVTLRFVVGQSAADVPADLKAAVLLVIGHLYANREAVAPAAMSELPMAVQSIVNRHWVGRVQ